MTFRKLKNDIFHLGPLERENEAIHIRKHLNHYANVLNELILPRNVSKNLPPHLIAASHVRLRPTHPDAIAVAPRPRDAETITFTVAKLLTSTKGFVSCPNPLDKIQASYVNNGIQAKT